MSDVIRIPARNTIPPPIGTRALRRKLKTVDTTLGQARERLTDWAWTPDDDPTGRLRALQALDCDLLDAYDSVRDAIHEVGMLLELAMDDYAREREVERAKVADLSARRAERGAA